MVCLYWHGLKKKNSVKPVWVEFQYYIWMWHFKTLNVSNLHLHTLLNVSMVQIYQPTILFLTLFQIFVFRFNTSTLGQLIFWKYKLKICLVLLPYFLQYKPWGLYSIHSLGAGLILKGGLIFDGSLNSRRLIFKGSLYILNIVVQGAYISGGLIFKESF